jgi:hypothetical protein
MTISVGMITIDTANARVLSAWWAGRLGGEAVDQSGGGGWFFTLATPGGTTFGFQQVADPTPGKNRLHVDFTVPDRRGTVEAMLAGGATLVAERDLSQFGSDFVWTVLADPEGNQFCVAELEGS